MENRSRAENIPFPVPEGKSFRDKNLTLIKKIAGCYPGQAKEALNIVITAINKQSWGPKKNFDFLQKFAETQKTLYQKRMNERQKHHLVTLKLTLRDEITNFNILHDPKRPKK